MSQSPVTANEDPIRLRQAIQRLSTRVGNHHTTHENGGADEISVTGLSGLLADAQTPLAHTHTLADITDDGTMAAQNANNVAITGGSIAGITDLAVADGGTGASSLTANNVILGNGTSPVQFVAPSTSGNVLTSNGTTWQSTAPATTNWTYSAKSADFSIGASDKFTLFDVTTTGGAVTGTLGSPGTLGSGFICAIRHATNEGNACIIEDGGALIDGAANYSFQDKRTYFIFCNGSTFFTIAERTPIDGGSGQLAICGGGGVLVWRTMGTDGTISSAGSFTLGSGAITNRTAITDQADADLFLLSDASDSDNLKKITRANLLTNQGFYVHRNGTNQTGLVTSTFTKIKFTTEGYDVGGFYAHDADDSGGATESRFTPTVAGKYLFIGNVSYASLTNDKAAMAVLRKNGSDAFYGHFANVGGTAAGNSLFHVSAIIDMNGSSDYVELFGYHENGSNLTVNGSAIHTYFMGVRVSA